MAKNKANKGTIIDGGNGYLVYSGTREKVIFYECDPEKNKKCSKCSCRLNVSEDESNIGFCSKTTDPEAAKDNGKKWYAALKPSIDGGEPYWGREYID